MEKKITICIFCCEKASVVGTDLRYQIPSHRHNMICRIEPIGGTNPFVGIYSSAEQCDLCAVPCADRGRRGCAFIHEKKKTTSVINSLGKVRRFATFRVLPIIILRLLRSLPRGLARWQYYNQQQNRLSNKSRLDCKFIKVTTTGTRVVLYII